MLIFPISLHLVKDVSLELKSIARPDVLQSIQDLLALGILLVPELWGLEDKNIKNSKKLEEKLYLVGGEGQNSKFIRELKTNVGL